MEYKLYAVLFKVNESEDEKYDCSLEPISLIEGKYNEETGIFTDELGIERLIYDNPSFINNSIEHVVGELISRKELKNEFPELTSIIELKKAYFNFVQRYKIYGKYNPITGIVFPVPALPVNFIFKFIGIFLIISFVFLLNFNNLMKLLISVLTFSKPTRLSKESISSFTLATISSIDFPWNIFSYIICSSLCVSSLIVVNISIILETSFTLLNWFL